METIKFDLSKKFGKFKILNATNGGPWHKRYTTDQYRSNFVDYKAVGFPYSRNHDSATNSEYGGPYSHDITSIFPNFDADPYDTRSYDFACTDESVLVTLDAGTKTFFRLGQSIEHQIKKHGTLPPKDFKKWAVICEHIIKHYNEGWADGYNINIEYWEIWNEPDLDPDDSDNKKTWGGTKAEFFDFFEVVAKHLKGIFSDLKIGGPALAYHDDKYAEDFLREMSLRKVPFDFLSWHYYGVEPEIVATHSYRVKELLIKYGYENTESILNEWNYAKGWEEEFLYTIKMIHTIKNASFITSVLSIAQKSPVDMLMYYDTRPRPFNGIFDLYTYEKLKGYYPMKWYSSFYKLENEVRAENSVENIYSICGVDKSGKITAMLTYYSDNDNAPDKEIQIDFGKKGKYRVYLLDDHHDGELVDITEKLKFNIKVHTCLYICEET